MQFMRSFSYLSKNEAVSQALNKTLCCVEHPQFCFSKCSAKMQAQLLGIKTESLQWWASVLFFNL